MNSVSDHISETKTTKKEFVSFVLFLFKTHNCLYACNYSIFLLRTRICIRMCPWISSCNTRIVWMCICVYLKWIAHTNKRRNQFNIHSHQRISHLLVIWFGDVVITFFFIYLFDFNYYSWLTNESIKHSALARNMYWKFPLVQLIKANRCKTSTLNLNRSFLLLLLFFPFWFWEFDLCCAFASNVLWPWKKFICCFQNYLVDSIEILYMYEGRSIRLQNASQVLLEFESLIEDQC